MRARVTFVLGLTVFFACGPDDAPGASVACESAACGAVPPVAPTACAANETVTTPCRRDGDQCHYVVVCVPQGDAGGVSDGGRTSDAGQDGGDGAPALPECAAQRVVEIIAGSGSLGWFEQLWPPPPVITGYQSTYAYDAPANAVSVAVSDATHPLFARALSVAHLWASTGVAPQPTVFVTGTTSVHATVPVLQTSNAVEIVAAGATRQASLVPRVPVIAFRTGGTPMRYGPASGMPSVAQVDDVNGAISALTTAGLTAAEADAVRPDAATVLQWTGAGAAAVDTDLATQLLFAANSFKKGYVATIILPGPNDDPHGAFANVPALTTRVNRFANILNEFYKALATGSETRCVHNGLPLSLADNTVLVINGDTPKQPFTAAGWPDGSPGGKNLFFVRSNGFLKPGYFGTMTNGSTGSSFDPATGAVSTTVTPSASLDAMLDATLFAIFRGDAAAVTAFNAQGYAGVRN